jgi:lysine N6-hydroxylase
MSEPWDLLGVGIGPVSLSLAALASTVPGLRAVFLDRAPEFRRHHGRGVDGAPVRVSFLADLVSLVAPAHPLSFLSYLADRGRIFPFYAAGRSMVDRVEYDDYCQWAVRLLPDCRFGHDVQAVHWSDRDNAFVVTVSTPAGSTTMTARNVVLGLGAVPSIPVSLRQLAEDPAALVVHAADYPRKRPGLTVAGELAVIGAGQSAAEVFLDLVRRRPPGRERVRWYTPTAANHGVGP